MALLLTSPIMNLYVRKAFLDFMDSTFTVTLYQNTQPTAADLTSSYSTYYPDMLLHWKGASMLWTQPNQDTLNAGNTCYVNAPNSNTAIRTGTATWAVIWANTQVTEAIANNTTLPNNRFIICPASDGSGNGIVKLTSTSITSGVSYAASEILLAFGI